MKNLIIIPAYNEEGNIENTVKDIQSFAPDFDYVIINDCSTDSTLDICRRNRYNCIDLPVNLGIGGAVQTGFRYAVSHGYDTAVQFDGDGQHDAKYLEAMLKAMEESGADLVIGSRFISKEGFQSDAVRRAGISWFSWFIKLLTGTRITDPTSGFRLANRSVIEQFSKYYPGDYPEPESIVNTLMSGHRITEVPVIMRERHAGVSSISMKSGIYYMVKVSIAILMARFQR